MMLPWCGLGMGGPGASDNPLPADCDILGLPSLSAPARLVPAQLISFWKIGQMTTRIENAHAACEWPRPSRWRTHSLVRRHDAALKPQTGTGFQLAPSYVNRNNRNRISYGKTFLSYDHVPMPSYDPCRRTPAAPALSSAKPSRPATNRPQNPLAPLPHSEQESVAVPKLQPEPLHFPISPAVPGVRPTQVQVPGNRLPSLPANRNTTPKLHQSCRRNKSRLRYPLHTPPVRPHHTVDCVPCPGYRDVARRLLDINGGEERADRNTVGTWPAVEPTIGERRRRDRKCLGC